MAVRKVKPVVVNVGKGQRDQNLVRQLTGAYNDLAGKFNTLLDKLDADAGITDTDYAATIGDGDTINFIGEDSAPS